MPLGKNGYIGTFSLYFDTDVGLDPNRRFYQLYPSIIPQDVVFHSETTSRSLEYWKEPDDERVSLVYSGYTPPDELKVDYENIEQTEPTFVKKTSGLMEQGWRVYLFDVEQVHALPGVKYEAKQEPITDQLIRALEGKGAWIEIVWMDYPFGAYLEQASMLMQSIVEEIEKGREITVLANTPVDVIGAIFRGGMSLPTFTKKTVPHPLRGSTLHIYGKSIAKEYFEKSQKHGIALSIRGMIVSKTNIDLLNSVFARVKISYDSLALCQYGDARMVRWLRSRLLPDPSVFLQMHAQGGFLYEWGLGRETIPVLCLNPDEISVFLNLPSDPDLPVKYARGGLLPSGLQSQKEGPELWKQE